MDDIYTQKYSSIKEADDAYIAFYKNKYGGDYPDAKRRKLFLEACRMRGQLPEKTKKSKGFGGRSGMSDKNYSDASKRSFAAGVQAGFNKRIRVRKIWDKVAKGELPNTRGQRRRK